MNNLVPLIIIAFVCGAEANTYTSRADPKAAVDTCLSNDATGQSCNMNSWDVSQVTDMESMSWGVIVQGGHLCVGHELREVHEQHVFWGDIVQRRYLCVGHELREGQFPHV